MFVKVTCVHLHLLCRFAYTLYFCMCVCMYVLYIHIWYLPLYLFCQCSTVPPSLQSIESGRNLVALSCSIKLVNAIVSAEKRDTPITDVRNAVYIGTPKIAASGFELCCFVFIECLSTCIYLHISTLWTPMIMPIGNEDSSYSA